MWLEGCNGNTHLHNDNLYATKKINTSKPLIYTKYLKCAL